MNYLTYLKFASRLCVTTLLVAMGILVGALVQSPSVSAQSVTRTITVIGEGKITLSPDIVRADIGVETRSSIVTGASAQNKEIIGYVLATLKKYDIADNDIQTLNYNIYADSYGPPEITEIEYRVNNMVSVIIRDLESLEEIMDAVVAAGANSIYGVNFQIEDTSSVESEARKKAVEDAHQKATELAELTGVAVGEVIAISEVTGNSGFYQSNFMEASDAMGGGGGAFAPGERGLVMRLQITYAIEPAQEDGDMAAESGGPQNVVVEAEEAITMFVAPDTQPCAGVAPQDCLQIKFATEDEWEFFYDQIEGFEHEPGFGYELLVTRTDVENPPADASSIRYTLVEVVAKIDVSSETETTVLDGTGWTLASIAIDEMITTSDIDETITATFEEGRMAGLSGCNNYGAGYTVDGNLIELGPVVVTRKACPEEQMERENEFLAALNLSTAFKIADDGMLKFGDLAGNVFLKFQPQ